MMSWVPFPSQSTTTRGFGPSPPASWYLPSISWNPPFPALVKGMILLALAIMTVQALLHLIASLRAKATPDDQGETH